MHAFNGWEVLWGQSTAWMKLVDNKGITYTCDPLTEVCPEAGIIMGP